MPITTLGLVVGFKCNIRCNSCLWGDRLESSEHMSVDDVKYYIDQASVLGTIRMVGFTGGEPTLFKRQIRAGIAHAASKYRIPSGLSTNCSWGVTRAKAATMIEELHGLGLRYLQISVDDFHQDWVSLARVRNVVLAALEKRIRCTLICVVSRNSRRAAQLIEDAGLPEHDCLEYSDVPCTPIGYAAQRIADDEFERTEGIPKDFCSMLNVLNIMPDGSVQTCCGAPFHMNALRAGNVRERPLSEIVEDGEWNPVFNGLAVGVGPSELVGLLPADVRARFETQKYTSACEACHRVFADPAVAAMIADAAEAKQAEYFVRRNVTLQENDREARMSQSCSRSDRATGG